MILSFDAFLNGVFDGSKVPITSMLNYIMRNVSRVAEAALLRIDMAIYGFSKLMYE